MIPAKYAGRYFFHMTDIENLESIFQNGLLCTNEMKKRGINHHNIASQTIQDRRSQMDVTCGNHGKIHDYVPFYLSSRTPMLLRIIEEKNQDQAWVIFFCIKIEKLESLSAVFTNASANTTIAPTFFDNVENLDALDWGAIQDLSWKCSDSDYKHRKMAEVLIWNGVDVMDVDKIVVYDYRAKSFVECLLKQYSLSIPVQYEPLADRYFYYKKNNVVGRKGETLVCGPRELKYKFDNILSEISLERQSKSDCRFSNVDDLVNAINADFTTLPELAGIYGLKTSNEVHKESVSDHTLLVVDNIKKTDYYLKTDGHLKILMELAAYLHDMGKGPKDKWEDGIQPRYPDHPADAIPMLGRIFTKEIEHVTKEDIRRVCLMVVYHDLIGDICAKGRNEGQLYDVALSMEDLNLLNAISIADTRAINEKWITDTNGERQKLIERAKKKIEQQS